MFKKSNKQKLILKKNYSPNKDIPEIIYPKVSKKLKSNNKTFNINNSIKEKKNPKKLSRISSAFLFRNYKYFVQKSLKKNKNKNSMIQVDQLNALLYKLKKYCNELLTYTKSKEDNITHLKNILKENQIYLQKMTELQNIQSSEEKITIKNYNDLKISKEYIENNLRKLIQEKDMISYNLKSEEDYYHTLVYMFEEEQKRLTEIKKESQIVEEKILNIKKYQKIVNENLDKDDKKSDNFHILNSKINKDIKLIDTVYENQNSTNEKLKHEIITKEKYIKELEKKIEKLKEYQNIDMQQAKNELKEKVRNAEEYEQNRLINEKKYIEIIYCLYIIQKYLNEYGEKNFDKNSLIQSQEYQLLLKLNNDNDAFNNIQATQSIYSKREDNKSNSEIKYKYKNKNLNNTNKKIFRINSGSSSTQNNIKTKDDTNLNIDINTSRNKYKNIPMTATFRFRKNKKNFINKKLDNKSCSSFYHSAFDINEYIIDINNLNDLIIKFNSIKITKNEIFDHISKLSSKLNFYRDQMNFYLSKRINLENMKTNYDAKVKSIISNDYFNFEKLTKNNQKCKSFLEKNEYYLKKMKNIYKKKKADKILEHISQKEELNDEINLDNNSINEKSSYNFLIESINKSITDIKTFFFNCSDLLKDIIISIYNISEKKVEDDEIFLKENQLEEETSNPFIVVFKKLIDFYKNKDVIISSDFKLLIQYIKNLAKFCRENNNKNILSEEDLEDIDINLLEKFYIKDELPQKIDKIFIKRFLAKNPQHYNNTFIHLNSLSDIVVKNVRDIYDLINSEENKIYLDEIYRNISRNRLRSFRKSYSPRKRPKISDKSNGNQNGDIDLINLKNINFNELNNNYSIDIYTNRTNQLDKFEELCKDEEDNESIDTSHTKRTIVKKKLKAKSMDEKIIKKLYNPFMNKTIYLRQLNPNIPGIKRMTSSSSRTNHEIKKMIDEVNTISHQMKIYNNPNLDINKLSNNRYNSLVKLIYDSTRNSKNNKINSIKYKYHYEKK